MCNTKSHSYLVEGEQVQMWPYRITSEATSGSVQYSAVQHLRVRAAIVAVVNMKNSRAVFWYVTTCDLVEVYRR